MTDPSELERLFFLLADLDEDGREAVLRRENVGGEMREKLLRMVAADASDMQDPLASPMDAFASSGIRAGDRFDGLRIVEKLGAGGMGDVWLARQETPVRRDVALKVVKRGMDTEAVLARFRNERQALALMDHPTLASVYGAGATPGGRPYFVMERVQGEPITQYCETRELSIHVRLELFLRVCDGVQHAHQKAIIHRDLKPSNVLVIEQDGKPLPKIIDFGVAKATESDLVEVTLRTEHGVMIGTPEYMSPEQANPLAKGVDTRTDVYSLGVILYELLTGVLPFGSTELRHRGPESIRRVICEKLPERPSTRVTANEDQRNRGTPGGPDLSSLRRRLAGDLDWIVLKSLEKEPDRRYGSPAELAADLRRHLAHEPVLAGPPGAAYRMGKFVRRHRAGVAMSGAMLSLLVLFAGGMTWQAQRVASERDRADAAAAQARAEATTAERVSALMTDIFSRSNPSVARGDDVTVRDVLDAGAAQVLAELGDEPEVQMRLLATIGDSYRGLALWNEAAGVLEKSLAVAIASFGEESLEAARAKWLLSYPLIHEGQFDRAERLNREALATMRRLLPPGDPAIGGPIGRLAFTLLRSQKDFDTSEMLSLLQESLALERQAYGEVDENVAYTLDKLGWVMMQQGRLAEAEALFAEALGVMDALYEDGHPQTGYLLFRHALALGQLGRHEEALAPARRLAELASRLYGEDHPEVAYGSLGLGHVYLELGRWDEAVQSTARAVEVMSAFTGPENAELGSALSSHGRALAAAGRLEEAGAALLKAEQALRTSLGDDHRMVASSLRQRGDVARRLGQLERAETLLRQAIDARDRGGSALVPKAIDRTFLAMTLMDGGQIESGCFEAEAAFESLRSAGIDVGPDVALTYTVAGSCLALRGDPEHASRLIDQGLEALDGGYAPGHPARETGRAFARLAGGVVGSE